MKLVSGFWSFNASSTQTHESWQVSFLEGEYGWWRWRCVYVAKRRTLFKWQEEEEKIISRKISADFLLVEWDNGRKKEKTTAGRRWLPVFESFEQCGALVLAPRKSAKMSSRGFVGYYDGIWSVRAFEPAINFWIVDLFLRNSGKWNKSHSRKKIYSMIKKS